MNNQKMKKLESILLSLISNFIIDELKDIESDFWLININWVKLSTDLSYLDVLVSSFKNTDILTKTLALYAKDMERKIYKKIEIRKLPKIRFRYDQSWEISQNIVNKINNL